MGASKMKAGCSKEQPVFNFQQCRQATRNTPVSGPELKGTHLIKKAKPRAGMMWAVPPEPLDYAGPSKRQPTDPLPTLWAVVAIVALAALWIFIYTLCFPP
jgi:hypothetical protein